MRRALDPASFTGDDAAFLAGRSWLYVRVDPTSYALVFFGRPAVEDIHELLPALATELAPAVPRHVSLVDASRISAVDPPGFLALQRYVVDNRAQLGEKVARLGLVRPSGFAGAVVAGFYMLLDRPPYPTRVVASIDDAARYLERPALPRILEPLIDELDATPAIVRRLHQLFLAGGFDLEVGEAARALALSPRTLQRRLSEVRTTFQDQLDDVRHVAARRLLEATELGPIDIAFLLGFAEPNSFARAFRTWERTTPLRWRAARS